MIKKVISLLFMFSLFLSVCTFADIEPMKYEIYYNGELFDVSTDNGYRFQYVPFAKKAGYETTYNAEENRVTSKRDKDIITFVIGVNGITNFISGEFKDIDYAYSYEINGSTYLNYYYLEELFDLKIINFYNYDDNKCIVNIYENKYIRKIAEEKLAYLINNIKNNLPPLSFTCDIKSESEFKFNSELFGTDINGSNLIDFSIKKNKNHFLCDINIDTKGIYNLYKLIYSYSNFYKYEDYINKISLEEPIKASFYYDGNSIFVKSLFLNSLITASELPWDVKRDYLNDLFDKIGENWIEYKDINDYFPVNEILNNELRIEDLCYFICNIAFDTIGKYGIDEVIKFFDIISELTSSNYLIVDENTKKIEYKLNINDFKNIINKYSLKINDYCTKLIENTDFNFYISTTTEKSERNYNINFNILVNSIPNYININIGSCGITSTESIKLIEGEPNITKPDLSKCLDFENIVNEANNNLDY